jgi:outer membrane protein assembly factor BamA
MTPAQWVFLSALILSASLLPAQCAKDRRQNKNAGILVTDFTITGTQTISATDLARITSDMIGSCYDEDSEEMEERLRAEFQDRGYFRVEVKSLRFKPRDPLGVPKPVMLEGDVAEGPQYRLADVSFVNNHAFPVAKLRQQFPLKKGALMERGKVASGLESLRKLYSTRGYLDSVSIPETEFGSNATVNLNVTIEEGPQYHMGKLEIVADKEPAARLRLAWKLAEGDVYDQTYIDDYITAAHDILPSNFSKANVQTAYDCPDALVQVRLIVDPAQDTSHSEPKSIPCEEKKEESNKESK